MPAENSSGAPKIERSFELERLVFFSDAVFAIAITLLALDLHVPDIGAGLTPADSAALQQAILQEFPRFLAFTLSFYIIGIYWFLHHRYFRYIIRYDDNLLRINLGLLFFVVLIPFTTSVLGEYGNLQSAIVLYALNLMGTGLVSAYLWYYATQNYRLINRDLDPLFIRRVRVRGLTTPLTALFVIALTYVTTNGAASFGWFLIFPLQYFVDRYYRSAGTVK